MTHYHSWLVVAILILFYDFLSFGGGGCIFKLQR